MAVKTFEDAMKRMVKQYWESNKIDRMKTNTEDRRYSKKYFDEFENELFPKQEVKETKKKIKKELKEDI